MLDDWDPNILFAPSTHEFRIYGDDREAVWAAVDEEDYLFFVQWRWHPVPNSRGKKLYLRRSVGRAETSRPLYLHVAIHRRREIIPPTRKHTMVDHIDGDSLNCRRENLRWATPRFNRMNRFGQRELNLP